MRKQVGFTFRVYAVGRIAETYDPEALNREIQDVYLNQGWEVLSTTVIEYVSNRVMLGVTLVKYDEELLNKQYADFGIDETVSLPKKRGPKPKNAMEEVAS